MIFKKGCKFVKKYPLLILSLGALMGGTPPALADARDDVLANTARCGRIADPRTWLDCYYGAAQPMRAQLGLAPAPAAQTRLVPGGSASFAPAVAAPSVAGPAMPSPAMNAQPQQPAGPPPMPRKKSGGILSGILGGAAVLSNMRASAYSFDQKGIFTITLSDGEVWQQLEDDSSRAQWRGPASRLIVSIKEGALSSDNLEVAGDNRLYKVRRVR